MTKMRKQIVVGLTLLIAVLMIGVVSAGIQASTKSGIVKESFLTTDTIYLKISKDVCGPISSGDVHIVKNSDAWNEGDSLESVADIIKVDLGMAKVVEIWQQPEVGEYDVVLDCYKNYGEYDLGDPIDSALSVGFEVKAGVGSVSVVKGSRNPGDHNWQYNLESPNLFNEMLQLSVLSQGEDVTLENITIKSSGSGDEVELDSIGVYLDANNNGRVDDGEELISEEGIVFSSDDGEVVLPLYYTLIRDNKENLVVAYGMKESMGKGDFSLSVKSFVGIGDISDELIEMAKTPINSGKSTILPAKTCIGEISAELNPNPAPKGSSVNAMISGMSGCTSEKAILRVNPCGSSLNESLGSCSPKDEGCEIKFTAESSGRYYVAIDKNGDEDFSDFGECGVVDLEVTNPVKPEEVPEEKGNETEIVEGNETEVVGSNETTDGLGITGGVIGEFTSNFAESGSLFILLEVTLLLILFVLVMIMFRLKAVINLANAGASEKTGKSEKSGKSKKEKEED